MAELAMAHLTAVRGAHIWVRTILMDGMEKRQGIICTNCRAYRFGEDPDRPLVGCPYDIDLSRLGNSRLGDHRNDEMARRAELNAQELAEDRAIAEGRMTPRLDAHLQKLLEKELDG